MVQVVCNLNSSLTKTFVRLQGLRSYTPALETRYETHGLRNEQRDMLHTCQRCLGCSEIFKQRLCFIPTRNSRAASGWNRFVCQQIYKALYFV